MYCKYFAQSDSTPLKSRSFGVLNSDMLKGKRKLNMTLNMSCWFLCSDVLKKKPQGSECKVSSHAALIYHSPSRRSHVQIFVIPTKDPGFEHFTVARDNHSECHMKAKLYKDWRLNITCLILDSKLYICHSVWISVQGVFIHRVAWEHCLNIHWAIWIAPL